MKKFLLVFVITCFLSSMFSQDVDKSWFKEFRTVIPGKKFEAGWFHEFLFGSHWRDVWTTPITVGVVDLNKYSSGLTPTEKGGGLQTMALKFKGNDGKRYKFRLLDKDPKKNLPKEIHESIVVDILEDQVCTYNPYAGFVVNPILDAYGIYHTEYTLAILPDDPLLGEYKSEFANKTGIMELVPDTSQFEGSDKVISSIKLLNRLNKEFDESVDSREFLMARFLDILLGDWDRHKDNWKWIMFDDGNRKIYKPYPMDRDQAFCKLDGIFPWFGEKVVLQLNNFGYDYTNMRYLNWNARYIDQRFLAFMPKDEWEKTTNEIYDKFTNELIENAVKKLPAEVYSIAKDEITEKLKSRRDQFKEASEEYYELVNVITDIYTTDKNDLVLIEFNQILDTGLSSQESEKEFTGISIFKKEENGTDKKGKLIKQKQFDNSITGEIRVYLQDGDDDVVINGKCDNSPKIRIIGGDGKDEIKNNSVENILFYDDGKKSQVSGDVTWNNDKFKLPYELPLKEFKKKKDNLSKDEKDKYEDLIGNLRYDPVLPPDKFDLTSFIPIFTYSPDFGPYFGGTYNYTKYGFRMNPYLYKLQFTLGYAPVKKSLKGLVADFNSDFMGIIKRTDINFHVRKSGIELNNYFGMGNNTVYNDSLSAAKYYKVEHEQYTGDLNFKYPFDKQFRFNLGFGLKHFRIDDNENTITGNMSLTPENKQKVNLAFLNGGVELDKRDHPTAPYVGYYFSLNGNYSPKLFNDYYDFGRIAGDLRGYIGYKTSISLALRAFGEKVIGDKYPFFESAYLGGSKTLRGYPSERFAGDGLLMGSAELRFKLFKFNFLFPQTFGLFGFGETGRVFLNGEDSKKWHASYGGGFFIHLINRDFTFKFTFARSDEQKMLFYFATGFGF